MRNVSAGRVQAEGMNVFSTNTPRIDRLPQRVAVERRERVQIGKFIFSSRDPETNVDDKTTVIDFLYNIIFTTIYTGVEGTSSRATSILFPCLSSSSKQKFKLRMPKIKKKDTYKLNNLAPTGHTFGAREWREKKNDRRQKKCYILEEPLQPSVGLSRSFLRVMNTFKILIGGWSPWQRDEWRTAQTHPQNTSTVIDSTLSLVAPRFQRRFFFSRQLSLSLAHSVCTYVCKTKIYVYMYLEEKKKLFRYVSFFMQPPFFFPEPRHTIEPPICLSFLFSSTFNFFPRCSSPLCRGSFFFLSIQESILFRSHHLNEYSTSSRYRVPLIHK